MQQNIESDTTPVTSAIKYTTLKLQTVHQVHSSINHDQVQECIELAKKLHLFHCNK